MARWSMRRATCDRALSAAGARVSLAPHAPYSTSLELFKAIRAAVDENACPIMSVHLGESAEEVEFLEKGSGPWRGMLETIGAWRDDWQIPACDPVAYLDRHGVIDQKTLVVHGVQFGDRALSRLAEIGATLVTCPRSNQWVGVGFPPIERFYQSGVTCRRRHRQPGQRRGSESVLRAEDDALAGAGRAGREDPRERDARGRTRARPGRRARDR